MSPVCGYDRNGCLKDFKEEKMKKSLTGLYGACGMLVLAAVLLAAAPASAQDGGERPWYLEAHGSVAFGQSAGIKLPQTSRTRQESGTIDVTGDVTFNTGWGGGLAAGRVWKDFRIEGEGLWRRTGIDHLEIDRHTDDPTLMLIEDSIRRNLNLTGSMSVLAALANVYWDVPTGMRFRPYVGAGAGAVRAAMRKNARVELPDAQVALLPADARTRLDGNVITYNDKDENRWGFCWQAAGGVAFDLTESLAVRAGYRFIHVPSLDFSLFQRQRLASQLPGTVTVRSMHSVDLGLRWRF